MEGWVQIKRGWFWQQRYGFISQQGSFKYFDDQAMTKLKRDFRLKDVQIVQDRMNKIIKFLQGSNESLQIKTDLHELWYQKLIQAKVQSMNISYIPQFQAQEFIRMNEQSPNVQLLEQQNINPNDAVSPLQLANTNQYTNMQLQRDQYQPYQQQNQFRTNQLQNQNQVFQEENRQNGLQQLAQNPYQQIIRQRNVPQSINPSNQIQPQNNLNSQNNQNKREVDYNIQKEQQQQKKDQGVFSKIKDFIIGKKEDYYDEKFVSELNNNINLKMQAKQKIEEIILPITTQTSLFNYEQYSSTVQYNFMQYIQLQNIFDQQRNSFPIKMSLSIFLMFIIVFNLIQWQKNQLIFTFCSIIISQLCVFFQHLKSKQVAIKCNVQAFTSVPVNISKMYTINQLLEKLSQINKNLSIFEQEKNKELFILDKNIEFQSVYQIQIKDSKMFSITIFTKNYEYLDSIIENFTSNFTSKTGIWKESVQRPPPNYNPVLDVIGQKIWMYFSKYQVYKENVREPVNQYLYVIFCILKDNWQFSYEIFCLIWLLLRLKNQQEQFNWSYYSNWFLLINYGITFTKLTFYLEEIFLSLRTDIKKYKKINEKAYNNYYKKDIYKIAFNQEEIQTQDKINDFEVLFVCVSLFASFVFRDSFNVIQIILLPALKPSFLKRYSQFYQIMVTVPFVITYFSYKVIFNSVKYTICGIFAIVLFFIKLFEVLCGTRSRSGISSQRQQTSQVKFFQASSIQNYQQQECSICLEQYQSANDQVFCCKNKHYYHKDCIIRWMNSGNFSATRKCPLCRIDLLN
ncbi:zinc finger, C3HC4 type (RING finger) protein (macronuclear) [Tetrahymena thermophila SB210]|uniref:Zinc finger, C3HC4 type (RING finger) protein n=1 Tax=Tetrahymena thermophila (strain SB210) TaxID=312017 RepID=W7X2I3_TETTS|nr:zinc finger, C3HC4 type (RING finger) protein [Tetrahymena thermophila SB210]EWS73450.1 zinc finger, C3HC4 type (RING finger) protein [Tetrahymena thermophila SB210]|eukprot:XP_012654021.1 zinc finger, C3HC4 type (RING finger) protein [Tetrahymena thermophila SB210]